MLNVRKTMPQTPGSMSSVFSDDVGEKVGEVLPWGKSSFLSHISLRKLLMRLSSKAVDSVPTGDARKIFMSLQGSKGHHNYVQPTGKNSVGPKIM